LHAGEENVTMVDDPWYPSEQILIHEFGHTVMDLGLAKPQRDAVLAAYRAAMKRELYDADCYMARCVCLVQTRASQFVSNPGARVATLGLM